MLLILFSNLKLFIFLKVFPIDYLNNHLLFDDNFKLEIVLILNTLYNIKQNYLNQFFIIL